jgi:hypothetical protein
MISLKAIAFQYILQACGRKTRIGEAVLRDEWGHRNGGCISGGKIVARIRV